MIGWAAASGGLAPGAWVLFGILFASDGCRDAATPFLVALEQVGPDTGDDEPVETLGVCGGDGQQDASAEAEADGIDGLVGELRQHEALEVAERLGFVRLGSRAVPGQVDRYGLAPRQMTRKCHCCSA